VNLTTDVEFAYKWAKADLIVSDRQYEPRPLEWHAPAQKKYTAVHSAVPPELALSRQRPEDGFLSALLDELCVTPQIYLTVEKRRGKDLSSGYRERSTHDPRNYSYQKQVTNGNHST
jgi:hypothetical protein